MREGIQITRDTVMVTLNLRQGYILSSTTYQLRDLAQVT